MIYKKLLVIFQIILLLAVGYYFLQISNSDQGNSIENIIPTSTILITDNEGGENEADIELDSGGVLSSFKDKVFSETPFLNDKIVDTNTYLVTRVIDGDTIEVEINGKKKRVRYIGVDTPETVHPSKPVQCFGKEASEFNKNLVEGKWVRLEKDISEVDKYGRTLRYVYVGDVFVNYELVRNGYADVITYPPDVKYTEVFLIAKREAQAEKRGLWGDKCDYDDVAENPIIPAISPRGSSCVIKGNINAEEVKIYHVPGCEYYDKTVISEKYGERWFCSEEEALEAGWRKALNCL